MSNRDKDSSCSTIGRKERNTGYIRRCSERDVSCVKNGCDAVCEGASFQSESGEI